MSEQRALAIAVMVLIGFLTLIQAADPVSLGVSRQFLTWCGILSGTLGILAGCLPPVQRRK